MAFRIAPFPGQSYPSAYANHHDIRAYLGFGKLVERQFGDGRPYITIESSKLPVEADRVVHELPLSDGRTTTLRCYPSGFLKPLGRGKSSAHRCFAVCPDCGAEVPAGRTHQHKCKGGAL